MVPGMLSQRGKEKREDLYRAPTTPGPVTGAYLLCLMESSPLLYTGSTSAIN